MTALLAALTAGTFRLAWAVVSLLPARVSYCLFAAAGRLAARRGGTGARTMRATYAAVRPDWDEARLARATEQGLEAYARYWCTAFRLHTLNPDTLRAGVSVEGDDAVRTALRQGTSVVCFLGHLGNWDVAGAWSALELAPVTTVAERLRPESVFQQFLTFRQRLGMTIIPLTGSQPSAFAQLRQAAQGGGAFIPLLADRDLGGNGIPVTWGTEPASAAAGPAALALSTGAMLVPVSISEVPDASCPELGGHRTHITFHPPVEAPVEGTTRAKVTHLTQSCVDRLFDAVRQDPTQWHMMQPLFGRDGSVRDGEYERSGA